MKYLILLISGLLVIISCHSDFAEINSNPNNPEDIQPGLLLRKILFDYGEQMAYEGYVAGNLLGQYFTQIDFNLFDRHRLTDPQFGGNPWPVIYTNLRDNQIMLDISSENPVYKAYRIPGLIMKAYMTAALTDIYGDIPYTEALDGQAGITRPSYDRQEDIYIGDGGILDLLDEAIESAKLIQNSDELDGDILFDGDIDGWVEFAGSLRIKYLMRISSRVNVTQELQETYDQSVYIKSNTQNATFDFTASQPNNFRMANLRDGDFNLFILSETYEDILKSLNDPRLQTLFRPKGNNNQSESYQGLRNGPDASATSISVGDYSLPGEIFRENTSQLDANFMTAWETLFLLSEAAFRGLINAPAKDLYDEAVVLAFEYWQTEMPENYLLTGAAAFDVSTGLEQILTQKYIANIINGYESWIEFRRTGLPALRPVSASLNEGLIPVKMPYPADEQALNSENFNQATMAAGNSVNIPVWWDID